MNQKSIFQFNTKNVVAIGIGAALYGFLGFFGFPIAPETWVKPAVAFLVIFGAMFGPVVGFLIGFIGHTITDLIIGGGVWWGWVLGSAIMGLFMGLIFMSKDFSVKDGSYSGKHVWLLLLYGILGIVVGMGEATLFDIFLMNEPFQKMMVQFGTSIVANVLVLVVLGLTIVLGILQVNKKNSNLTVDK